MEPRPALLRACCKEERNKSEHYVWWHCVYAVVPCKAAPEDAELSGAINACNSPLFFVYIYP